MSNSTLNARQQLFMAYLLGEQHDPLAPGEDHISAHIVDQGGIDAKARLAIYRNACAMRFRETIETDHEILGLYLGDDLFDEMVAGYVKTNPLKVRSLRQYADALPGFLAKTEPFVQHPQIAELARFERLLLTAFDAADYARVTLRELESVQPAEWPQMQFRFHPSFQLFYSEWQAVPIWQALKSNQAPPEPGNIKSIWAVWRNSELLTEFRSITKEEHALLLAALAGKHFSALCEILLGYQAQDNVAAAALQYLQSWIQRGWLGQLS